MMTKNTDTKKQDDEHELIQRRNNALKQALGELIMQALEDPDVTDIMLNDDSKLWVKRNGIREKIGTIDPSDAFAIVGIVATSVRQVLTVKEPIVSAELPIDGSRFEGLIPPITENPIFAIRKKTEKVYPIEDYIRNNIITFTEAEYLRKAIERRANIQVVGGTGSGKTTFCNALLDMISKVNPTHRMLIIEDIRELQCAMEDRIFLRESEYAKIIDLAHSAMRLHADRICVGELRSGGSTLELLKLWNTGHPGGLCTIHANSALDGLIRTDQLIQEVSNSPQRELIGQAINICVYLEKVGKLPSVEQIIEVEGYDSISNKYITKTIFSNTKKK